MRVSFLVCFASVGVAAQESTWTDSGPVHDAVWALVTADGKGLVVGTVGTDGEFALGMYCDAGRLRVVIAMVPPFAAPERRFGSRVTRLNWDMEGYLRWEFRRTRHYLESNRDEVLLVSSMLLSDTLRVRAQIWHEKLRPAVDTFNLSGAQKAVESLTSPANIDAALRSDDHTVACAAG